MMWTQKQRQGAARLFFKRLLLLGLLAFIIFAADGVWSMYQKERDSKSLRVIAENEHGDLERRQAQLKESIEKLRTDRGIEEVLREQFSLAEMGEQLIVIVEAQVPAAKQASSTFISTIRSLFWFW